MATLMQPTDVVLVDGTTARLREVRPDDAERVAAFWDRLSAESIHLRFFGLVRLTEERLHEFVHLDPARAVGLVATLGADADERIIGMARYDVDVDEPTTAEYAVLVEDAHQGRGIGTALVRRLAEIAREQGVTRLVGDVLATNARMLNLLKDLGLEVARRSDGGVVRASFDVQPTDRYLAAVAAEEKAAAQHALERFLRPATVAVVGASRTPGTIGNLVFRNLVDGDFTGVVYPVNPKARAIRSIAAYPSLSDCPEVPDVVFVCVPAPAVIPVVDEAGRLGVRAVCVISAGFAECGEEGEKLQEQLMTRARAHGLRIVGPNCMGLLDGAADVRMNATFSRVFPEPGRVSFLSQSGALGLSVLDRFERLGLGISSFVSVGNKADVSGNDLLLFWEDDPATDVILMYLESFGNPRRFSRIARRVAARKPIVVVKAGRTAAGKRAAASHTAALSAGDVAVDALFRQTGVIRTDTLEEMLAVTSLLSTQPAPAGSRVAVLTNGGGPGILAADACEAHGLTLPSLSEATQAELSRFLPAEAGLSNPVDMIASASAEDYEQALRVLADSGEVDAVIVVFIPPIVTRAEDVARAIARARDAVDGPLTMVAVFMDGGEALDQLAAAQLPTFAFPEEAARALGHAARWATWRDRPQGSVVRPTGLDTERAQAIVDDALAAAAGRDEGVWLGAADAERLLQAYGIALARSEVVHSAEEAAEAQRRMGRPVVVKLAASIHKSDVGGVVVGPATPDEAADAVREIEEAMETAGLSAHAGEYLVQEMIGDGVEMAVGVTHDPSFGPLVMVGLGGTLVELIGDVSVRITPLTDTDVDEMLDSLRSAPLLTGYRGSPPVDVAALRELLYRINALVEDVHEIVELDLNPVFVREQGIAIADVRLRAAPVAREAGADPG